LSATDRGRWRLTACAQRQQHFLIDEMNDGDLMNAAGEELSQRRRNRQRRFGD
jgi:fructose-specific component phosphotransferase system IIB-like protein